MSVSNLVFDLPKEIQELVYGFEEKNKKKVVEQINILGELHKRCKNCGDRDIDKNDKYRVDNCLYINMYGVGNYSEELCFTCFDECCNYYQLNEYYGN